MLGVALRATALAAVCFSGSAWAADLTPVIAPEDINWAGAYLGVEGGYDWGQFSATGTFTETKTVIDHCGYCKHAKDHEWSETNTSGYDGAGGELGVFGGKRWEKPNGNVFGFEGDVNWKDLSGTSEPVFDLHHHQFGEVTTSVDWYGTLRAVLGKAHGKWLIYGTGGLAFGGVSSDIDGLDFLHVPTDSSGVRVGWTLGGGFAYAIKPNLILKLEYAHVDLGEKNIFDWSKSYEQWCWENSVSKSVSDSVKFDAIRVGLAFKFGQPPPVVSVAY
jgi:outer membrane immunogenic protein